MGRILNVIREVYWKDVPRDDLLTNNYRICGVSCYDECVVVITGHERGKREDIFVECRKVGFGVTSTSVCGETWLATENEGVDSARHRVRAQGD